MTENQMTRQSIETGQTLQRVATNYVTAVQVQKPRKLSDVYRRLNEEALKGGETMFYGWGAGKDQIEGPSIQLATAAARSWGNCAVEMEDVQDLGDSWVFTAVFIDVETGFTLKRQFRQSKTSIVYGKHDEERKADIRFQIGQSKATRNVVLNALPKSMIKEAVEAAKSGVRQRLESWIAKRGPTGMADAQEGALSQLAAMGIDEARVLDKLNRPTVKALTLDDLIVLKGDITALNEGAERPEELYPQAGPEGSTEGIMDHLGGGDEDPPFPVPDGESGTEKTPKAAQEGAKRDSGGETPAPPMPDTPQAELGAEISDGDLFDLSEGAYGSVAKEIAEELRARYNRLGEDREALTKYVFDLDIVEAEGGDAGLTMIENLRDHYLKKAVAEGMGPEPKPEPKSKPKK